MYTSPSRPGRAKSAIAGPVVPNQPQTYIILHKKMLSWKILYEKQEWEDDIRSLEDVCSEKETNPTGCNAQMDSNKPPQEIHLERNDIQGGHLDEGSRRNEEVKKIESALYLSEGESGKDHSVQRPLD